MNKLFIYQLLLLITLVSCTKETSLNQRIDTDNISQKIKDIVITKLNNNEITTYIKILCDQRRKLIKYLKKNRIETSFSTRLLNLSKRFVVSNKKAHTDGK